MQVFFRLIGLSQHHQSNAIHELPGSVDRLKNTNVHHAKLLYKKCQCHPTMLLSLILLLYIDFLFSLRQTPWP